MVYPLIILGAGASFDSINIDNYPHKRGDLERYRPPLTNDLFNQSREIFYKYLSQYPRVNSLSAQVLPKLADNEQTFEEILQSLLDLNKVGASNRQKRVITELISLGFYLSDLFSDISDHYYEGDNNYIRLLKDMDNKHIKTFVVNFNYDLIFEKSAEKDLSDITSYISGNIKVLKIHGACNWVYKPVVIRANTYDHAQKYFAENADDFFDFFVNQEIYVDRQKAYLSQVKDDTFNAYMPAVALPFNKKTLHACPTSHVQLFENEIEKFDRVIIIGWRGTDEFITTKLAEKLIDRKLPTFVITNVQNFSSRTYEEEKAIKNEIKKRYASIPQLTILDESIFLNGFSNFMRNYSTFSRILSEPIVYF